MFPVVTRIHSDELHDFYDLRLFCENRCWAVARDSLAMMMSARKAIHRDGGLALWQDGLPGGEDYFATVPVPLSACPLTEENTFDTHLFPGHPSGMSIGSFGCTHCRHQLATFRGFAPTEVGDRLTSVIQLAAQDIHECRFLVIAPD